MTLIPANDGELPATPAEAAAPEAPATTRFQAQLNVFAASTIILVGIIYLLREFAEVCQHLLVALFLMYMIVPVHQALVRRGAPGWAAYIVIVAALIAGLAGLGIMVGNSFQDLETKLPQYRESLGNMLEEAAERFPKLVKTINSRFSSDMGTSVRLLQGALHGLSDFISRAFLVAIYLLFILAERAGVYARLERAFGADGARDMKRVIHTINASITQYILVKACMGLFAGVFTTVVLLVFDVDYAALWGVLAFLFNYIPYLGSVLATIAPVLLSLVQFQNIWQTLAILIVLFVMQTLIGYLIEPRIAGRRLGLRPLVIIVSLAFWGSLWGIVGMILAVPLMVAIKTILENMPPTQSLAKLLSHS